ncbi:HMA domain-containing protein, partial [Psidium guajava]
GVFGLRRRCLLRSPQRQEEAQEAQATPDGGDKDKDGLRGVRKEGAEVGGRHEGGESGGGRSQAEQADRDRVCGPGEGAPAGPAPHRQGLRLLALRALRHGGPPLRPRGLRQEGPAWVRPERAPGPAGLSPRPRQLHRGHVHHGLQRREPQRLRGHVE